MPDDSKGHLEKEDYPWVIAIPFHAPRRESATYVVSRDLMHAILTEAKGVVTDFYLGQTSGLQDHHGGGLWVKDADGWMLLKNLAGMEWSQQFCADPVKVDHLRRIAQRVYKAFPLSIPALKAFLGARAAHYPIDDILDQTIVTADVATTQANVARWVDSIFNASVPLYAARHTGVLAHKAPTADGAAQKIEGGVHHYPTPITDVQLFKHDDFQLWVLDAEGQVAAVTPAHPRGSGRSEVNVAYATPGTELHKYWARHHEKGDHLTLPGDSPLAQQAFAAQPGPTAGA